MGYPFPDEPLSVNSLLALTRAPERPHLLLRLWRLQGMLFYYKTRDSELKITITKLYHHPYIELPHGTLPYTSADGRVLR